MTGADVPSARRLAVRAATAEPGAARSAWTELVDRFDLADLWDEEVYRLLPLVWRRLGDDVGPEHTARLKGIYRKTWFAHQRTHRRAAGVVAALRADGVDALVIGGLALALTAYEDPATRRAEAVDLLVPPEDAVATWRRLEALGLGSPPPPAPARRRKAPDDGWYLRGRRPRRFALGPLDAVVVHTTLAPGLVAADPIVADLSDLWARAVALDLGGTTARTLAPSDHLLHALLPAGAGADGQRVVDAWTLLRPTGGDPGALVALVAAAQRHRCTLVVATALERLRVEWEAPVPPDVGSRLLDPPPDRRQRIARRLRSRRVPGAHAAADFALASRGLGPVATVTAAPSFLADRWLVDRPRHLPLVAVGRLTQAR